LLFNFTFKPFLEDLYEMENSKWLIQYRESKTYHDCQRAADTGNLGYLICGISQFLGYLFLTTGFPKVDPPEIQ